MHSLVSKSLRATLLTLTLVLVVVAATPITSLRAQTPGEISIVCENETTTPGAYDTTVTLTTADGYISIPDGNTVYMWGYAYEGGAFQHPGPTLCFNEGDVVEITLNNIGFAQLPTLTDAVSVVFPGQTGVEVDTGSGFVPVQPQ
ncbi:MAG: hypothetical protein AAB217_08180, partial [Chloroflexota bacterium]